MLEREGEECRRWRGLQGCVVLWVGVFFFLVLIVLEGNLFLDIQMRELLSLVVETYAA